MTINWTREMLVRFKKAYGQQRASGKTDKDVFTFEGHEFMVGYSKYLIEFLEIHFEQGESDDDRNGGATPT